uniref:Secreted protein n=1 Tax=Panagrellus redivivus TaxID=6233 RepID=A0A7E4VX46_PANRE
MKWQIILFIALIGLTFVLAKRHQKPAVVPKGCKAVMNKKRPGYGRICCPKKGKGKFKPRFFDRVDLCPNNWEMGGADVFLGGPGK